MENWLDVALSFLDSPASAEAEDNDGPGLGAHTHDHEQGLPQAGGAITLLPADPESPPTLPHDVLEAILEPGHHDLSTKVGQTCDQAHQWLQGAGASEALDDSVLSVAAFFLDNATALHASKEVIGKLTGQAPKKIEPILNGLAGALYHADRFDRKTFEATISHSNAEKLLYLELVRFDETPMRLTERQLQLHRPREAEAGTAVEGVMGAATPASGSTDPQILGKGTSVVKLFASELKTVMLVKVPFVDPDTEVATDLHCLFELNALTHLQILEKASGEVMSQALNLNMFLGDAPERFKQKLRLCTADKAGANVVAERRVMQGRSQAWKHLMFPCNVHIVATCHQRTFSLVPEDIKGIIHFSLSLSHGAAMARFRRSLTQVVNEESNVEILRGPHLQPQRLPTGTLSCSFSAPRPRRLTSSTTFSLGCRMAIGSVPTRSRSMWQLVWTLTGPSCRSSSQQPSSWPCVDAPSRSTLATVGLGQTKPSIWWASA